MSNQQSDLSANTMGAESSQIEYCGFDISALPQELFMHVLTFVPAQDVVCRCSLVCKYWYSICRDEVFWRRSCEKEGKYDSHVMGNLPLDFAKVYIKNPLMRNFLKNPKALEDRKYWMNPGNFPNPEIEQEPYGADPITDYIPAQEINGAIYNWVASYRFTCLKQQVSIIDEGCSEELMDNVRPPIHISVWYAARFDCGIKFQVRVELKSESNEQLNVFDKQLVVTDAADRRIWHKLEYTFTDYKPGVRKITFTMGGVDTQFWAGNYGPKFTLPCIRFAWDKFDRSAADV